MNEPFFSVAAPSPVTASNGGLFLSRGCGRHPDRTIDSYEIIFVRSGSLYLYEAGENYTVKENETLILFPGLKHGGLQEYEPGLSFYWLHFYVNRECGETADGVLNVPKHARLLKPENMTELFRSFLNEQGQSGKSKIRLNLDVLQILCEISESAGRKKSDVNNFARQADLFIHANFHKKIGTGDIAANIGCNADYLGRVYRGAFGVSVTDAVNLCRIRYACSRLLDGTDTIDRIALESGFSDPGYFRRVFKKAKGMSPLKFRNLYSMIHLNIV